MVRDGLLIGEVAKRSGASRKALRLYEQTGILPAPQRTHSGYRLYSAQAVDVLFFVRQAQRLGFTLGEIKEIVAIRRAGRAPCPHVRDLVRRKAADLDRALADLAEMRRALRALLSRWESKKNSKSAAVCPHIESANTKRRRE
jgi:DNA-binding transcriptional MerR regulator